MSKFPLYSVAVTGAIGLPAAVFGYLNGDAVFGAIGIIFITLSILSMAVDIEKVDDHYQFGNKNFTMRRLEWVLSGILAFIIAWPLYLYSRWLVIKYERRQLEEIQDLEGDVV
jgi:hypothetical protein